jgi:hypothetical protein
MVAAVVCMAILAVSSCLLAQPPRVWWRGAKLEQQLTLPVGITWKGLPLREALEGLGQAQQIAVVLDRRIDPNQAVDFECQAEPLDGALRQLAAGIDADAVRIGPAVFIGPRGEADRIATSALLRQDEVNRLPKAQQSRWTAATEWSWPQLATPLELLEKLARENQIRFEGLEQIPHDLWPATDLPPMAVYDRLSLLLAGFGMTYALEADGQAARIVPVPATVKVQATYTVPRETTRDSDELLASFRREFPKARLQRRGNQLILEGTWREHHQLQSLIGSDKSARPQGPLEQRYTLRVENKAVGSIARQLAQKLDRRLEVDPRATDSLRKLVSFEVKDATREGLLKAVFDPAGLQFTVDEQRIRVLPP